MRGPAAIVLNDLGSTAYYVGGISEQAVGKSAPWFILGIMLFSYAVRAVYIESCSMFVRGGVYKVVHEAMGGTLAKFSVSALMFDYVLTGPISGVSAAYLAGLINDARESFIFPISPFLRRHLRFCLPSWPLSISGGRTSSVSRVSHKALRIMQVTTVMVVILPAWCLWIIRLDINRFHFPLEEHTFQQ
jgi:amino acid transporter